MTNSKITKRALFSSVVALLLCFTMLLGTTYAWFTDSAASGSNVITAGNLDIDVQYTLDGTTWKPLDGATDLFKKGLWEPGHTEVVALKIANNGTLALKYAANMNIVNETTGLTKDGAAIKLSDILTVSTLIQQANEIGDITVGLAFSGESMIAYGTPTTFNTGSVLGKDQQLLPGTAHYLIVKVDMAETVGNEANHDGTHIPTINFGINVLASQFTYEYDSFGNQYDNDAEYVLIINTIEELRDAMANGGAYKLGANITVDSTVYVSDGVNASLDLNGYSITNTIPETATVFHTIMNSGNLTVSDSAGNGQISSNSAKGYVIYTEGGSLTVDGAKIVGINNGYAIVTWTAGDSITIEEGTIVEGRGALYIDGGATGTVNGGTYTMTVQTTNNQDNVVYVSGTSELTINAGTFSTGSITGSQRLAIAALGTSKVTINGGTFYGLTGDIQSRTAVGNVTVTGGTFTGTKMDDRTDDSIAITGGTYSYDPTTWCAAGYAAVDNSDGTWTVSAN